MRNIIPILFVAATLLAGCRSPSRVNKTTTVGTNTVASTNAVVATPGPVSPNTVASTNAVVATPAPVSPNTVASTNAVVATPAPVGPNTPAEALSENLWLGNLGAAFIVILAILALSRPGPSALRRAGISLPR